MEKGVFTISLDTELAWGSFDKGISNEKLQAIKKARYCISELIKLMERYEISATWAMVGHLMLDRCNIVDGIKYPEIIRPNHHWFKDDWFKYVPIEETDENSIWFGSDILRCIRNCKVYQEIASHSFSHIIFGDEGCSEQCAESDIKKCIEISKEKEIELNSFIFPRNSEGFKDILKKYGFICYRGEGNEWYKKINNKHLKKAAHIFDDFFALSPPTSNIQEDEHGLYNIKGNMLYLSREGLRKYIPMASRVNKAKKGIDKAIDNKEIFHLWFHPFNLGTDPVNLLMGLEKIFAYVRMKIDEGLLENYTMGEIVRKEYQKAYEFEKN